MSNLEAFKIDLKKVESGLTEFKFHLDREYFEAIDAPEVREGDVSVALEIQRSADVFRLTFHSAGTINVPCDLCLDDMPLPIDTEQQLIVKFGEEDAEEGDVLIVDENEGMLDTSWLIYEQIALSIPMKHVHEPGKCNVAMTKKLEELSVSRSSDEVEEMSDDPRWNALKSLKI